MCGRYRLSRRKDLLAERFDVEPDDDWEPRYNIAPTQNVPVIRQDPEQPKRLVVVQFVFPQGLTACPEAVNLRHDQNPRSPI